MLLCNVAPRSLHHPGKYVLLIMHAKLPSSICKVPLSRCSCSVEYATLQNPYPRGWYNNTYKVVAINLESVMHLLILAANLSPICERESLGVSSPPALQALPFYFLWVMTNRKDARAHAAALSARAVSPG